ncbi:MAG TPA: hypothetical protein VFH97_03710 [Gemmatimonadales bacterium]|nr:hypothetical protein [Gemmatimonadales bacterium]
MSGSDAYTNPPAVVRAVLAVAALVFGMLGFLTGDARVLAAAGALAIIWTAWDLLWDRVFGPSLEWAARLFTEGAGGPPADTRPTLDDTIRLLESHLARDASRSVHLQAAIRLEEIYRTIRKDPARARAVIERVRQRYPDAEELRSYARDNGMTG